MAKAQTVQPVGEAWSWADCLEYTQEPEATSGLWTCFVSSACFRAGSCLGADFTVSEPQLGPTEGGR
jgi:hypothetical protein